MDKNMKANCFTLVLLFLCMNVLLRSQQEQQESFSLSTYKIYWVGDSVSVTMYNPSNYKSFAFRLLRLDDPEGLIKKGVIPRLSRDFDIWGKDGHSLRKFFSLEREWDDVVRFSSRWEQRSIQLGKFNNAGIFLLQAKTGNKVAYCPIFVNKYVLGYKQTPSKIVAFVTDGNTGEFLSGAKFNFFRNDSLFASGSSQKDGLLSVPLEKKLEQGESLLITAKVDGEVVLSNPFYFWSWMQSRLTSFIYTNQPVYRPGEKVFFKGILRNKDEGGYSVVDTAKVNVVIKSPKYLDVFSGTFNTDAFGSIWGEFVLDNEAEIGQYSIILTVGSQQYYGQFQVEEYNKPEYKVEVTRVKDHYLGGEIISGKVKADYYFGSPVKKANVLVQVYRKHFWMPWWYWSSYSWFYKLGGRASGYFGGDLEYLNKFEGEVDENGELSFDYKTDESTDVDYTYLFSATVTDASRREVAASTETFVTRGEFTLSTWSSKYFVQLGDSLNLTVRAYNFSSQPVQTDFKIIINKRTFGNNNYDETVDKLNGTTQKDGEAKIKYLPPKEGYFFYTVIAKDKNGREITATSSFYVNTKENCYYRREGTDIEIATDKEAYEKGDTLTAIISLPKPNLEVLVSFERGNLLSYQKYKVEGSMLTVKQKLTREYCQNFSLSVLFVKDHILSTQTKSVAVFDKDNFLTMEILPAKGVFKPAEKAVYKIKVKKADGSPAAETQLSFGSVDESIYAIQEETTEEMKQAFYKPEYFYLPTLTTISGRYYNTSSRRSSMLDKHFPTIFEVTPKGKYLFGGKFLYPNSLVDTASLSFLLVKGRDYYETIAGDGGTFTFRNIPAGNYEFCLLTRTGFFRVIQNVDIKKDVTHVEIIPTGVDSWEISEPVASFVAETDNVAVSAVMSMTESNQLRGARVNKSAVEKESAKPFVTPELRKRFEDAACWIPDVVTDSLGEAEVSFILPDNLTTWRATVRAITKKTEVAQETNLIIVRKNLLVRMETPRFFREGDELVIATNIHNYLSEKKKVKIAFKGKGLRVLFSAPGSSTTIPIDANDEARIDWKVKVEKPLGSGSEAELYVEALTDEESDAMQVKVPVLPNGVKQTFALNAVIKEASAEKELTFSIPKSVDLSGVELSFSLSPTLAGNLLKSVDDLVAYPYGCVEQTMSRFLPAIIVANTLKELSMPAKNKTLEQLPDVIDKGLKRLYSFQHYDGGWGWWEHDQTHPYMTVYVIYGLSLAQQAGYAIDSTRLERGRASLLSQLKKGNKLDETTAAFMFYALAQDKQLYNQKEFLEVKQAVDGISKRESNAYTLALFAAAYKLLGDVKHETKLFERLMDNLYEKDQFAFWKGKEFHYQWTDDDVQSTAFALKYLLSADAESAVIPKIVAWLLSKQIGYSWNSTQQTAAVLFALTDYLKISKELEPDFTVSVLLNGEKISEKRCTKENVFDQSERVTFNGTQLKRLANGENKLTLVKSGKGTLYFSGFNRYFINTDEAVRQKTFEVTKEYFTLKEVKGSEEIIYKKELLTGAVKSGEAVFVKITVKTQDDNLQYFMLEDPFPSGFEIEKNEDRYIIDGENEYRTNKRIGLRPYWRWSWASKEIRDEKISFFMTLAPKEMTFTYILKAQIPGSYSWLPAEASLMYYPEQNGLSGSEKIEVSE